MATSGGDRYSGGNSTAYSPFMRQPNKDKSRAVRVALALILTVFLPPLGILYAWRAGVFPTAGLVVLTVFGCLLLGGIFYVALPNTTPHTILPTPGSPQRVTAVSDTDVTTALSNIDSLLGLAEESSATEPQATLSPEEEAELARQQEIFSIKVYAVNSGAKYYHVDSVCRGQINSRELTIGEAIEEGLQPCGRCKPPRL